jgi:hypothetical protein
MQLFRRTPRTPGKPPKKRVVLAQIESRQTVEKGATIPIGIGLLVMIAVVIFDHDAIHLIAWGTIWTGWNVLSLFVLWQSIKTDYAVVRFEDADQGT